MFIKLKKIRERFRKAVVFSPVEAVVSSVYFLTAVVSYYQHIGYDDFLGSFPICFCLIYAVNRFSRGTGWRWLYYISVLSIGGFWVWNLRLTDSIYWITLIVSQLLVLLSARAADNDAFVRNGLCYVRNMVAATVLALVGWLLAWAIYRGGTVKMAEDLFYAVCGVAACALGLSMVWVVDKNLRKAQKWQPRLVAVHKPGEAGKK